MRFLKLISFIVNEEKSLLIYFVWIVINGNLQDQLLYARYLFKLMAPLRNLCFIFSIVITNGLVKRLPAKVNGTISGYELTDFPAEG